MDFDEDQEEEIGMHQLESGGNYQELGEEASAAARRNNGGGGGSGGPTTTTRYRYRECLKNHAVGIGGHAVDGCGEFMPAGDDGALDALKCAACGCHRNFHRKEEEAEGFGHHHGVPPPYTSYHHRTPHHPSGHLNLLTAHHRPLALPSSSRDDDVSNPSSSGGGGGGSGSKKRFRTKFTQEQKEKMLAFAERIEWRIQKQDDEAVQEFCASTNIRRQVFKVWMHNNKHTLGKNP